MVTTAKTAILEAPILNALRKAATAAGARLFRNQVGFYRLADGRKLRSGLAVGSSDLIGWTPIKITPEMVGSTVAVFTSVEVKALRGRPTREQISWLAAVLANGGRGGVARNEKDLHRILDGAVK